MILKSAMERSENITYQQVQVRKVIYDCEARAVTNQVSVLFCSEGKKNVNNKDAVFTCISK